MSSELLEATLFLDLSIYPVKKNDSAACARRQMKIARRGRFIKYLPEPRADEAAGVAALCSPEDDVELRRGRSV